MIVLLEGCNATGKSSLAQRLSEALDWSILKFIAPTEESFDYFRRGIDNATCFDSHIIIDRCHLSNWAYGDSEGGTVMTFDEWLRLDWWLRELGTWLFLMVGDPMEISQRLYLRVDQFEKGPFRTTSEVAALQRLFIEAYELSQIEIKGTFDYSTFLQEENFNHLVSEIRRNIE